MPTRPPMKNFRKDGDLYDRQYMHQPPLIPHDTRNYEVDNKVNKCLACHSFKNASAMKAPKISPTHFETRDGMTLGEVSPPPLLLPAVPRAASGCQAAGGKYV